MNENISITLRSCFLSYHNPVEKRGGSQLVLRGTQYTASFCQGRGFKEKNYYIQ
jgi:hypothetical protein